MHMQIIHMCIVPEMLYAANRHCAAAVYNHRVYPHNYKDGLRFPMFCCGVLPIVFTHNLQGVPLKKGSQKISSMTVKPQEMD